MNSDSIAARWAESWHLGLSPDVKLVYAYLLDHCNEAGFWKEDIRDAEDAIGKEINWKQVALELNDRLQYLPNDFWWLSRYITERYGWLDQKNPDHRILFEQVKAAGVALPLLLLTPPASRPDALSPHSNNSYILYKSVLKTFTALRHPIPKEQSVPKLVKPIAAQLLCLI